MPTCKKDNVVTILTATGTLIRPMRMSFVNDEFMFKGPYVHSAVDHDSDILKMLRLNFPQKHAETEQYFNVAVLTIPFGEWTMELAQLRLADA
jgi:hypothetical protein